MALRAIRRPSETVIVDDAPRTAIALYRLREIVWTIAAILETLLLLRFILLGFGARAVGFAAWLYHATDPLVRPFSGIFPSLGASGMVIDFASILAIVVVALVAAIITAFI